jgi:hypothetical protein
MERLVTTRRKTLMTLSWEIQRKKHTSRSKALQNAWVITQNDDIVIYYLTKKHSPQNIKYKAVDTSSLTLFKHS